MYNKKLEYLIKLLQEYNQWKFVGRDKPINELIADIEYMIKEQKHLSTLAD